eukprot:9491182-Pyramimonas_sp.AAC.1
MEQACVHQLIEAQVEATPHAVAIHAVDTGRTISYIELNGVANRIAEVLRDVGVRRETCVAVFVDEGPGLAVCELAVLKAAGAFVPLDPAYPSARLQHLLSDCGATIAMVSKVMEAPIRNKLGPTLLQHTIVVEDFLDPRPPSTSTGFNPPPEPSPECDADSPGASQQGHASGALWEAACPTDTCH